MAHTPAVSVRSGAMNCLVTATDSDYCKRLPRQFFVPTMHLCSNRAKIDNSARQAASPNRAAKKRLGKYAATDQDSIDASSRQDRTSYQVQHRMGRAVLR